jgi:hypothetical protein
VDDREIESRFPAEAKKTLLRSVQTGCWVHAASYPMVTGFLSQAVKPEREADHSRLSNIKVKKPLRYNSTHIYALMP